MNPFPTNLPCPGHLYQTEARSRLSGLQTGRKEAERFEFVLHPFNFASSSTCKPSIGWNNTFAGFCSKTLSLGSFLVLVPDSRWVSANRRTEAKQTKRQSSRKAEMRLPNQPMSKTSQLGHSPVPLMMGLCLSFACAEISFANMLSQPE